MIRLVYNAEGLLMENTMSTVVELENAVAHLSDKEYVEFREWFLKRDWEAWDRQIEADSASGQLDFLVQEARDAKRSGGLRDL